MKEYECKPGAVVVQFKFADTPPQIYTFRRVLQWREDVAASSNITWSTGYEALSPFPADKEIVPHSNQTGDWITSNDEFSIKAADYFQQALVANNLAPKSVFVIAELWLWTSEGWCLKDSARSW